jgi:S1-C subfamily serine protease
MKVISIILVFILTLSSDLFAQENPNVLNGYKFAVVDILKYDNSALDVWGISSQVLFALKQKGFIILRNEEDIKRIEPPLNEILYVFINHSQICEGCGPKKVNLTFKNYNDEVVYTSQGSGICVVGLQCEVDKATKKALSGIYTFNYRFNSSLSPLFLPITEKTNESEQNLKEYFNNNNLNQIEGIYKSFQSGNMPFYKFAIKKRGEKYIAIIIDAGEGSIWKPGEVKAYFEPTSIRGFYSVKWYRRNKTSYETFAKMENEAILSLDSGGGENELSNFIKIYPSSEIDLPQNKFQKSSGSGFIISSNGIIATNAHVIDNATSIRIQTSNEVGNIEYNAKVLLKDNNNDVALIKIDDLSFKGFSELPYGFAERAEIGEKAFTIGYPLNDIMGTNYKVTDGIVSSTSGINDDIRYLQISVPLQPGNSGGPLFNNFGDIIGITSARLNSKAVGTDIENVNYAIKISYLLNLYSMLPDTEKLKTTPSQNKKELQDQVKTLKNFVCLIKVN